MKNKPIKTPPSSDARTLRFKGHEPRVNQLFTLPLAMKLRLNRMAVVTGKKLGELIVDALLRTYPELR